MSVCFCVFATSNVVPFLNLGQLQITCKAFYCELLWQLHVACDMLRLSLPDGYCYPVCVHRWSLSYFESKHLLTNLKIMYLAYIQYSMVLLL